MTSVPTLPPDPALLHTPTPDATSVETGCARARVYWLHIVTSFGLSYVETEVPATQVGHEPIGAGMLIMASGGSGKPLDYGELERCSRAGYGIGARSNGPGPTRTGQSKRANPDPKVIIQPSPPTGA
jgi:hypothetical protein